MNETQEEFYKQALELSGYNSLSLRAMCLWAFKHASDKSAMRAASAAWNRNARLYARVAERRPELFQSDAPELCVDDYLILLELARLNEDADRAWYDRTQAATLQLYQLRDEIKAEREKRSEAKPKHKTTCPRCGYDFSKDGA